MADDLEQRAIGRIAIHIFSVSAAMVGVCLTVIGIVNLAVGQRSLDTLADDLLAFDALLFLVACLLAYAAMRSRDQETALKRERIADIVMLAALGLMVVICLVITYALI